MSSIIDNQAVSVQQLLAPICVGAGTNISPSLPPIAGYLASDTTTPGILYVGNGTSWVESYVNPSPVVITGATLTLAGQPTYTVGSIYLSKLSSGTYSMKTININIVQSQVTTSAGIWQSANGVIPAAYLPLIPTSVSYTAFFPCVISGASAGFISTYFFINTSGAIGFHNSIPSSDTVEVYTLTANYM